MSNYRKSRLLRAVWTFKVKRIIISFCIGSETIINEMNLNCCWIRALFTEIFEVLGWRHSARHFRRKTYSLFFFVEDNLFSEDSKNTLFMVLFFGNESRTEN